MRCYLHAACSAGAAALLGLLLAIDPAAAACDPDNAIFEDDFEFLDGSWGPPADNFNVEAGVLVAENGGGRVNFQATNEVADVCVDATIVEAADPDSTAAWVIFWFQDWDNYYTLGYWGRGSVQISRRVKGKFLDIAYIDPVPALKAGLGQTNNIELKMTSKDATVFVNGAQVTRFKGKPPKGGAPVGLVAGSEKPAKVTFDNFVVSEPAE
jgi:hypothetical protein